MGGECSGGFHPLEDLSSGYVFHLLLRMAKTKDTFCWKIFCVFGGFAV